MKKKIIWIAAGALLLLLMSCTVWTASKSEFPQTPSESALPEFSAVVSDVSWGHAENEDPSPLVQVPVDESWKASEEPNETDDEMIQEVSVEEIFTTDISKDIDDYYEDVIEDRVIIGEKESDTVQIGPASGEDRNDEILEEKEEQAPVTEDEKPIVIEGEESSVETPPKEDVTIQDEVFEGTDSYQPEYNPSIGGENPFDSDSQTEIDDTPVEDYIGDGEERPGEGIQF